MSIVFSFSPFYNVLYLAIYHVISSITKLLQTCLQMSSSLLNERLTQYGTMISGVKKDIHTLQRKLISAFRLEQLPRFLGGQAQARKVPWGINLLGQSGMLRFRLVHAGEVLRLQAPQPGCMAAWMLGCLFKGLTHQPR